MRSRRRFGRSTRINRFAMIALLLAYSSNQLFVVSFFVCKIPTNIGYECCLYSVGNLADMLDTAKQFTFQPVLNATLSVDTFFLLGYISTSLNKTFFIHLSRHAPKINLCDYLPRRLYRNNTEENVNDYSD